MNIDILDKTHVKATQLHLNNQGHRCGYCKGKKPGGSKTWGLVSEKTRVDDYENMLYKGWRRCGTYYYKTDLKGSCCQLYTIRLKAAEFQISPKQRKILAKFNRFLNGELDYKLPGAPPKPQPEKPVAPKEEQKKPSEESPLGKYEAVLEQIVTKALLEILMVPGLTPGLAFAEIKSKVQTKRPKNTAHGDIATNAALILFNANKKASQGKSQVTLGEVVKMIVEKIESACAAEKFKVTGAENGFINFVAQFDLKGVAQPKKEPFLKSKGPLGEEKKSKDSEKMTDTKPEKEEAKVPLAQQYSAYFKELVPNLNPNPVHKYTVEIVPAVATAETFEIFKAYQKEVHGEPDKTMDSYQNFLCDSPLYDPKNAEDVRRPLPVDDTHRKVENQGIWPRYLGSYHMYHRIDGKLVAVGVLDFTPSLASSVYFFYDPKYKFLNWGIVGALREIEYVNRIREKYCPTFEYYCMGYYIQDCVKSVYKGDYVPSYLLCPETYTWILLTKAKEKIAKSGYSRLADPGVDIIDDMKFSAADMKKIMTSGVILMEDDVIPFEGVAKRFKEVLTEIIQKLGKSIMDHLVWTE